MFIYILWHAIVEAFSDHYHTLVWSTRHKHFTADKTQTRQKGSNFYEGFILVKRARF